MSVGKVPNKKNNYYFRVAITNPYTGKLEWKYKSGFATKSEAVLAEAKYRDNYIPELGSKKKNVMTFGDLIDDYLEYRKKTIKQASYQSIEYLINKHIQPTFKKNRIDTVTRPVFLDWRNKLSIYEATISYKNKILNEFKMIASYANRTYGINYSFIQGEPTFRTNMNEQRKKVQIYTEEQFLKLHEACSDDLMWQAFFTLLFYTGMRMGEIRALKWSDYKESYINVEKSLYTRNKAINEANNFIQSVKTKSSVRKIFLPEDSLVVKTMNAWYQKSSVITIFSEDWYIFGDDKYIPETNVRRKLIHYVEKAGLHYINPHAFRHSYTTLLFNKNVNPKITQAQLGHGSISVTLDTYTKLSNNQISDTINDAFSNKKIAK